MHSTRLVNNFLDKFFGIKIKKTRLSSSSKAEWPDSSPVGMVDQFGRKYITGWVSASVADFPIKITLNLNGFPIHSTWANVKTKYNTTGMTQSFYIGTRGIWDYCKKKDRLTVRIGDKILPITNKGVYKKARDDGEYSLEDIKRLLSEGYIFNRRGDFQLSKKLDREWQEKVILLNSKVSELLKRKYNITPFLIYGSLLGQVREGTFIGHDDDFDIAYISKYSTGKKAAVELTAIAKLLRDNGFGVDLKDTAIHIHDKDGSDLRIDLFHLFFNKEGDLCFPFGIAGTSSFTKEDWNGITEGKIAGNVVYIPKNAKKMVEHIYGSSWRIPIAGFNWEHARTKLDESGMVPESVRKYFNQPEHQ